MRCPQQIATKGSQRWIQLLTGAARRSFESQLRHTMKLAPDVSFNWRSPLEEDDYAEYRDASFLDRLGLDEHRDALRQFWPSGGPQWDGLGTTSDGKILLIEAKAHLGEMRSSCNASPASRALIESSLKAAKAFYSAQPEADWTTGFYQYANRLAHLYFLRDRGVDAHLLMIYFTGDSDVAGPKSAEGWMVATDNVRRELGLPEDAPIEGVVFQTMDVAELRDPPRPSSLTSV